MYVADLDRGPGFGRYLPGIDGDVATRRTGIERVPQFLGGTVEVLLGLDRHMPVAGAVITIPDEALSFFGDNGLDRSCRQAPTFRDVYGNHLHIDRLETTQRRGLPSVVP